MVYSDHRYLKTYDQVIGIAYYSFNLKFLNYMTLFIIYTLYLLCYNTL